MTDDFQRAAAAPLLVDAGDLQQACVVLGPPNGTPCVLLHGFPYDVHAYAEVAPVLAQRGLRVIVPWLRGYGPTRFLSSATQRSGQQAALAHDLLSLLDGLRIERALLAGYDWGGRAACIVAALQPHRVIGLVSGLGYNIQNIPAAAEPAMPVDELRYWYQYYLHGERGRRGLTEHRAAFCRLLWSMWSPNWRFDDATYERSAASFDNDDFVAVVVHSYRHRYGLVPGDPRFEAVERHLTRLPSIATPTIALEGDADGVAVGHGSAGHGRHFLANYDRRVLAGAGHNLPQEDPLAFAQAVLDLR